MAYIALYRKYRPRSFTDVVGQHQVSDTLMRAVREDKVAHAYLFAGPRGTGKTSMAKIFARAVNCEHGPTDHPCNECAACRSILNGQSMDVLEIDAASNRGIDEIRALRESVKFMPVEGRKKVFIIDEAHMLTNEAWNALLKTIEEPPAHVMFIFATTEIEKLPVTIVSRCQRYTFRRITADDIAQRLLYVADKEEFTLTDGAARLIAVHADGGLRDALSILDQCTGMAAGDITPAVVEDLIGLVSKSWIIGFLDALRKGDGLEVLRCIQGALDEGRDATQIMEAFIQHIRALLVAKAAPDAEELKVYDSFRDEFFNQAGALDYGELNHYIRSAQAIMNDAKQVDNPRTIIEMGLLVLCADMGSADESMEERINALERAQRGEREQILNRLSQLEQRGITEVPVSPAMPGGGESFMEDGLISPPVENGQLHPAAGIGQSSHSNAEIGRIPPPKESGRTPASAGGAGMVPPPIRGSGAPTGASRPAPKSSRKADGISTQAHITEHMVSSDEYRNVQGTVIKYLKDSKKTMVSTILGQGQLVYVDRERAVMAFKTALQLNLVGNENNKVEIEHAFAYALGYPVTVETVDAATLVYQEYRHAATKTAVKDNAAPAKAAPGSDAPVTPSDDDVPVTTLDGKPVSTSAGEIPSSDGEVPIEVPPIDAVTVEREYPWDPANMTEQEKRNPLLAETLEKLSEDNDIIVEVIKDE